MVQALADLFARLEGEPGAEVRLAYLEIYNENVRDLFAPEKHKNLELREDPVQASPPRGPPGLLSGRGSCHGAAPRAREAWWALKCPL